MISYLATAVIILTVCGLVVENVRLHSSNRLLRAENDSYRDAGFDALSTMRRVDEWFHDQYTAEDPIDAWPTTPVLLDDSAADAIALSARGQIGAVR